MCSLEQPGLAGEARQGTAAALFYPHYCPVLLFTHFSYPKGFYWDPGSKKANVCESAMATVL